MNWMVIKGLKPWDGRYELDLEGAPIKFRETGWMKRYAGCHPKDVTFDDPDCVAVLAMMALHRAGKVEEKDIPNLWERLQDAPVVDTLELDFGDEQEDEGDADPTGSSNANGTSSGDSSRTVSGSLADPLSPTGQPSSATSLSDQPTLVS